MICYTITRKIVAIKMNDSNKEIHELVQKLEHVLSLLDESGYSLPAIKVEEALSALRQLDKVSEAQD